MQKSGTVKGVESGAGAESEEAARKKAMMERLLPKPYAIMDRFILPPS